MSNESCEKIDNIIQQRSASNLDNEEENKNESQSSNQPSNQPSYQTRSFITSSTNYSQDEKNEIKLNTMVHNIKYSKKSN